MNKIIATFLCCIMLFSSVNFSFAVIVQKDCEYTSKWNKCNAENKSGEPWSIDPTSDFMCIRSLHPEQRLYNIALHELWRDTDEKLDDFMDALQENKDYYFGAERVERYPKGVDRVEAYLAPNMTGLFYRKYAQLCNSAYKKGIIQTSMQCIGAASVSQVPHFFNDSVCEKLAATKLTVYKATAYNILSRNKGSVREDEGQKYQQDQRSKYEYIVNLMIINIGFWQRILKKWSSKTKRPYK